jgi:8-oxo-dGTP diphosphatase
MAFCYEYPRPALTTDVALFTLVDGGLHLLLIRRGASPYAGRWALPGGFVRQDEQLEICARRELAEETGVEQALLMQFGIFDEAGRDPRGWIVSVAYLALVTSAKLVLSAGTDAAEAQWFPVSALPPLAFDHADIARQARTALRERAGWFDETFQRFLFALLPQTFTLSRLQSVYEAVIEADRPVDKRNFRKMILGKGILQETGGMERGSHRPAQLYEKRRA